MTETCKKCAECCKNHPFVDLSDNEILSLERATGLPADQFTNRKGNDVEEFFLQFKENGHCFFLNESDGRFSCSAYAARPAICRNYPSKPIQKDLCDANMAKLLNSNGGGEGRPVSKPHQSLSVRLCRQSSED